MVPGIVQSKKAVFILIWSAIIHSFYVLPFVRTDVLEHSIIYRGLIIGVIFILYPLSGWLADVYLSRYKAMFGGLLTVILGTTLSTIFGWTCPKAVIGGFVIVRIGYWMFDVNAIMYGFEQLETYSTENHRVFIYWFYWTLEIGHFLYGLCVCISAQFDGASHGSLITSAVLGSIQVVAMITVAIVMLVRRHSFGDNHIGYHPFKSIINALRDAIKKPMGLKKLTMQNGGLYSSEVIGEVRTFLYILSVIVPLSIVYYTEEIYTVAIQFRPDERNSSEIFQQCLLTEVPTWIRSATATLFLPIYIILLTPIISRITHYKSLLSRMGLGLVTATLGTLSLFAIELKIYFNQQTSAYHLTDACVTEGGGVSYYWLIIPEVLNGFSVVIVFSTTLEFICAQSSSAVRGLLIGLWFAFDGINKVVISTQEIWRLDCNIYYYVVKLVIVFIFMIVFLFALRMYTHRNQQSYIPASTLPDDDNSINYYSSIDNSSDRCDYYNVTDSALNQIPDY